MSDPTAAGGPEALGGFAVHGGRLMIQEGRLGYWKYVDDVMQIADDGGPLLFAGDNQWLTYMRARAAFGGGER